VRQDTPLPTPHKQAEDDHTREVIDQL